MTEHWLKQPKVMPSHIVVVCQKWRGSNHHKTPAQRPSLAGVGMSLDQVKYTYPLLTAFIMTELWLKKAKNAAQPICVECQKMKVLQPPQNPSKSSFPDRCWNEFGSNKTYLSMFNSFCYDWSLAEATKHYAQPHCCWVPKNEGAPTTTIHLQKGLLW